MTLPNILLELFGRVAAIDGGDIFISEDELSRFPAAMVNGLKSQKIIVKSKSSGSAICPGCEESCLRPIYYAGAQAFVVCDKRDDTNRVKIRSESLAQWKCCAVLIRDFTARNLGVRFAGTSKEIPNTWEVGIVTGNKRSQMVCLQVDGDLFLVAGTNRKALVDCVVFNGREWSVDQECVSQMVDSSTTGDARYTPNQVRQEARKLATQTRHQNWQKEYIRLKKSKPNHPDSWYATQIAKMEIADGCSAETIRKNMKK